MNVRTLFALQRPFLSLLGVWDFGALCGQAFLGELGLIASKCGQDSRT